MEVNDIVFSPEEEADIKSILPSEQPEETIPKTPEETHEENIPDAGGSAAPEKPEVVSPVEGENPVVDLPPAQDEISFTSEGTETAVPVSYDTIAEEMGMTERGESAKERLKAILKENAELKTNLESVKTIASVGSVVEANNRVLAMSPEDRVKDFYKRQKYTEERAQKVVDILVENGQLEMEDLKVIQLIENANQESVAQAERYHAEQQQSATQKQAQMNASVKEELRKIDSIAGIPLPKDSAQREQIFSYVEKQFNSGEFQKMLQDPKQIATLGLTAFLAPQIGKIVAERAKTAAKEEILKQAGQPSKAAPSGVHRAGNFQENDEFEEELDNLVKLSPSEFKSRRQM